MASLVECRKCKVKYDPQKSTSSLKLTWCNTICEGNELGFNLAAFERMQIPPRQKITIPLSEVVNMEEVVGSKA